ncbi:MAG TPA: 2-oxoglutarate dehydrogenase complex dihydrolipoyllysine-residue succinyltransferase [Polyangiaceae bacterium]|nr:2-oxoglutarate dehydrogenase complex dihydrolipoyllysine-residue succinyltransferase [Polyangiaceae bacterium]
MAIELKVPTVGESITEVQMGEWLKGEGDSVARDEVIAKIETDKVTVDLTAPNDGVLSQIKVKKGQTANVGDVIGYIEEGAAAAAKPKAAEPVKAEAKAEARKSEPPAEERPKATRPTIPPQGFARVMPSARRALKERGLSPDDVEASGPGGRVLKEDVDRLKEKPAAKAPVAQDRQEEVVAMSPFRKRIAERLVQSQQTAALLTTFNEVDMGAVMELRKAHQEAFQEKYGIKLGFMSFFVKAAIEALKQNPSVNAEIRGNDVVYKNFYDIGVAVGGGKGLAVPVIRNAERLGFAEVELAIADFGKRAKDNKLELSELQGGTFTISNGGIYGSMMSTPIVNPPQSGILGLHAIQDRPMAIKGQVVIRPMMYVALTYDHRLVDGREAVTFLKRIKQCMEEPARILLEV